MFTTAKHQDQNGLAITLNSLLQQPQEDIKTYLSSLSLARSSALSPELLEPRESLSPLEPLSLPGP